MKYIYKMIKDYSVYYLLKNMTKYNRYGEWLAAVNLFRDFVHIVKGHKVLLCRDCIRVFDSKGSFIFGFNYCINGSVRDDYLMLIDNYLENLERFEDER